MESIDQVWIYVGVALIAGALLGALLHRIFSSAPADIDKLRTELEQARSEMERYKSSVNSHFDKTSDLVSELTQDYVKVYQHLAEGAQTLSDTPEFAQVLEQSRGKVLISMQTDSPEEEAVVGDAVSGSVEPAPDAASGEDAGGESGVDATRRDEATTDESASRDQPDTEAERKDPPIGEAFERADDAVARADDSEAARQADSLADSESEPKAQAEPESVADSEAEPKSQAEAEPESRAQAEPKYQSDEEPEAAGRNRVAEKA